MTEARDVQATRASDGGLLLDFAVTKIEARLLVWRPKTAEAAEL